MVPDGCGLDELLCALLNEFNVELSIVVPLSTHSRSFVSWNVEKYFFFCVPILMASDGGGLMNCNRALLYEFNIRMSIVVPFSNTFRAVEGWNVGKYFFSRVSVLMTLDRCGSDGLQCAFLKEFHIKLSIVVLVQTVGSYTEKYVSSAFQFSWPRVVVVVQ